MLEYKILVVEDEPKVANVISRGLAGAGLLTDIASDGLMGKNMFLAEKYALIILDINLPLMNGYALCQEIRKTDKTTPIIMLTALDALTDKLDGFDAGADDYMSKPFEIKELIARVNVFIRRTAIDQTNVKTEILRIGDLELDMSNRTASRNGKKIVLTTKEYSLLYFFMTNPDRVISKSEISEKIWDINFDTGTNIIEVYVNYLRNKIDKDFEQKLIQTHRGLGYVFQTQPQE